MLSLSKLERLLSTKGFIIKKIFSTHSLCVYIEILCVNNADIFLLYIPSKYEIRVERGDNVYKMNYIEMDELDNIAGDYAGEPDNLDLEMVYDDVEIAISPDKSNDDNLARHLDENYKRPISLKDITKTDTKDLKNVFRQLNRLRFCTQSIKYKLAIQFKNYMCFIRRDDSVDCSLIRDLPGKNARKLFVIVDLETMYNRLDSIQLDVKTVREGIYRVLDKNQLSHTKTLRKMLEEKSHVAEFSETIYNKKLTYVEYIQRLETMLSQLCESEKKVVENLLVVEEKYDNTRLKGLHTDIEKSHVLAKYETELNKINLIKQDIIKNILTLKSKREDTFLFVDSLLFDNSVMVDAIIKNINKASKYTN